MDDAEAAFNWLLSEGYEPGNIITIGHSIGGFIAVALALRLRDKKQPLPGAIVSISPWCDLEIANETITANAETDKILSKDLLEFFRDAWIGGTGVEFTDTRINLNRADLSGLPPTLVSWGTYEVLVSEDEEFAARVKDAGIDTATVVVPGGQHSYVYGAYWVPRPTPPSHRSARGSGRRRRSDRAVRPQCPTHADTHPSAATVDEGKEGEGGEGEHGFRGVEFTPGFPGVLLNGG